MTPSRSTHNFAALSAFSTIPLIRHASQQSLYIMEYEHWAGVWDKEHTMTWERIIPWRGARDTVGS
ncbi:uncharacterized protein K460DRAFT_144863 [Cucurbitaria berberidis CBS 394.84]|uniref:Uncharacterized protein n=1 Tax=Cucurbitaria berberidis CBS 394.84 TaxID=1168544 RepID=A0A9P4GDM2_9PLEO|nr:uncharacterized protein K460DRAFT_144863 [Cucurbitaria berberidis CBS 394.84]KAF1843401.1 hypothetical protein K460DRAFT_144863 [Cucurbitaria berberidis CBS 394.84]